MSVKKLFPFTVLVILILLGSCKPHYTPKPRGYFRISFPEKSYHQLKLTEPYSFQVADYSIAVKDTEPGSNGDWITITTPANKADLHITYAPLQNNLNQYIEDSRKLAYDHSIKADAINERLYINPKDKVYGTIYFITGNAASPMQFYLTDSLHNFLRGALYIREIPNIDSISPVIDFLQPDVIHLIETTKWKNNAIN